MMRHTKLAIAECFSQYARVIVNVNAGAVVELNYFHSHLSDISAITFQRGLSRTELTSAAGMKIAFYNANHEVPIEGLGIQAVKNEEKSVEVSFNDMQSELFWLK